MIIYNSWTQRSWFPLHISSYQITRVAPCRGDPDKQRNHKSGSLKHFYGRLNEGDELSSGTHPVLPGHRKWALCAQRVSKAEAQSVFRKWVRNEKLLTQRIPELNSPHSAILFIGSNYSWPYCSNSTKGWLVYGVLILPFSLHVHTSMANPPPPQKIMPCRTVVKSIVSGAEEASVNPPSTTHYLCDLEKVA